ncbi:glycosyltransferase family 4 protein [uncultured Cloacibacillus sp.]|uniref:glycosyltransferase family 4 protein n=1 Tax=uncultured Cloacibacillus sp. TaxID=889794 RepID=UPI0026216FA1|nr:glycosyltransferase family 4 protein [uncultured Cloacibacillus sp.]
MMRVLHYVDESNLAWGETWVQLLAGLSERGVENFVACRDYGTLTERLEKAGIEFGLCRPLSQALPFTNRQLGKFIDGFRPDLIHTRLSSAAKIGGWWGKHKCIPVLQTIDKYPKLKYHKDGDFFAACSSSVRDYFISLGVPMEKITVVHNPIDVSKYTRDESVRREVRTSHNVAEGVKIVLAAGRFVDWKGFDVLIRGYDLYLTEHEEDAAKSILWIVGGGEEKEKLTSLAANARFRDRIKIFPFAQDVRPYMWAADLFVLPSKTPEPFGIVLLEAMACGLPAIATKAGGPLDIIEDGVNGWFVKPNDEASMAEELARVLPGTSVEGASRRACERAASFGVGRIAQETTALYEFVTRSARMPSFADF